MTQRPPKINLRIERIVSDNPALERASLHAALEAEVSHLLTRQGPSAFGSGGETTNKEVRLPEGNGPVSTRIAAATIKAVSS